MGIDAIIALVSLLAPPVIDVVKKVFIKPGKDSPEATMSTLATTKPEALEGYVNATANYLKAQCEFFNRDVTGTPAQWVITLRASIRPIGTAASIFILTIFGLLALAGYQPPSEMKATVDGLRYTCEAIASSWFGTRITAGTN